MDVKLDIECGHPVPSRGAADKLLGTNHWGYSKICGVCAIKADAAKPRPRSVKSFTFVTSSRCGSIKPQLNCHPNARRLVWNGGTQASATPYGETSE